MTFDLRVLVIVGIWKHIVKTGHKKDENKLCRRRRKEITRKIILKCLVGVLARWSRAGRVAGLYKDTRNKRYKKHLQLLSPPVA